MVILLWDASALAKRYAVEAGSATVDALFASVPTLRMVSSAISYAEIYSVLLRKFNRASIDRATYQAAKSLLRAEMINDPDFVLLSIDDRVFYQGVSIMETYNLNTTDAALQVLYRSYSRTFISDSRVTFLLAATDERLLRAAQAEGIRTVNPELLPAAEVPEFLSSL